MKSRKEVCLTLEALEDRMALNGAFGGAIGAGVPLFTPFNSWVIQPAGNVGQSPQGVQGALSSFYSPSYFLTQMQAAQSAQMAVVDQLFSEVQSLLHAIQPTFVVP